jgi:DNA-binding PadR family transcriptional regulator
MAKRDRPPTLTDAGFQILLALADGEHHGYEIMQLIARTGGTRLGPTTLYRTIRTLEQAGLVEESDRPVEPDDDERRRYYRLTDAGREAAQVEIERLRHLLAVAESSALGSWVRPRTVG